MSKNIKVIDNFLSESYFQEIKKILEDSDFGWYFQKNTVTGIEHSDPTPFYGFRHLFVADGEMNSMFGSYIMPVVYEVCDVLGNKLVKTLNVYSNLVLKKNKSLSEEEWHKLSAHNDGLLELEENDFERWTGLIYIDNSDGDTVFFEKNKNGNLIEIFRKTPTANTLVLFPSRILHSPGLPYKSFMRRVININILVKKEK